MHSFIARDSAADDNRDTTSVGWERRHQRKAGSYHCLASQHQAGVCSFISGETSLETGTIHGKQRLRKSRSRVKGVEEDRRGPCPPVLRTCRQEAAAAPRIRAGRASYRYGRSSYDAPSTTANVAVQCSMTLLRIKPKRWPSQTRPVLLWAFNWHRIAVRTDSGRMFTLSADCSLEVPR